MMTISLSLALSVLSATFSAGEANVSDEKLLIIHADDVGMCHSVNEATSTALKEGIVTSASIMVPCPWFLEIAEYCRENPEADMGIHITLTSEWKYYRWCPVSSMDKVPGLIDEEGYLWHSVEDVVEHATPEEVETEIRAQIQRAIDFGIKPTHIDTHMGTVYATPEFFKAYFTVATEFGIIPMIVSPDSKVAQDRLRAYPEMKPAIDILRIIASQVPTINDLPGVSTKEYEQRKEEYKEIIRNLEPGITQIIVHLGLDDSEMHNITSSWLARYNDFLIFTEPEMSKFIEDQGVKLIGWRDLK